VTVSLRGELDLSNATRLREHLDQIELSDDVIVDVSGVPFIDSVALGVLAGAAIRHRDHGSKVVLAGARPFIRKVLAITRLGGLLPDLDSTTQAKELLDSYGEIVPDGLGQTMRATSTAMSSGAELR
jgi:anti-anti-sigma factor